MTLVTDYAVVNRLGEIKITANKRDIAESHANRLGGENAGWRVMRRIVTTTLAPLGESAIRRVA